METVQDKYKTAKAFRIAIANRLKNLSRQTFSGKSTAGPRTPPFGLLFNCAFVNLFKQSDLFVLLPENIDEVLAHRDMLEILLVQNDQDNSPVKKDIALFRFRILAAILSCRTLKRKQDAETRPDFIQYAAQLRTE